MTIERSTLPYGLEALEPHISRRTMDFHYNKHHQAYVDKLNLLIDGTEHADKSLEEIILATANRADQENIFNNAAQSWNHAFFWTSMKPYAGGKPLGRIGVMIDESFGVYEKFHDTFVNAAVSQFGSGWVWLVMAGGKLEIMTTSNAWNPLPDGVTPLLVCDLWEHAYYLDYQNRRADFVKAFLDHLANWDQVATRI